MDFLRSPVGSGYCADAGIIVNGEWIPHIPGGSCPPAVLPERETRKPAFGRLGIGTGLIVRSLSKFVQIAAAAVAVGVASPVFAATDIMWWHAMSGELGKQVDKLAADFNASQSEYRIVPSYKGNYTETVTAAIFAFRSRSQPAIVQVAEIATATMMAAKGAIYPVFELMQDQSEPFSPADYLPAVSGYYTDVDGNMLSFPFNASTPILYYNKNLFRAAGLDPEVAPKTWPEVGAAARKLRAAGM